MDMQTSSDLNYVYNVLTSPTIARHSSAVMGYVCLFEVSPFHLRAPKFRRIMEEMKKLFDAESFTFQKKRYSISHAGIVEALDLCIKKNFDQSLENHNYLKRVMITIAEREGKDQSRQGEKDLRKKEAGLMIGHDRAELNPPQSPFIKGEEEGTNRCSPEVAAANIQRIHEILGGAVKKI